MSKTKLVAIKEEYLPIKGSKDALCYDLKSRVNIEIAPWEVKLVPLGIKTTFAWKLYPRSSLPFKKWLMLANSVWIIDKDYRGEAMAMLYNFTKDKVSIAQGERIAQMEVIWEKGDIKDLDPKKDFYVWEDMFEKWEDMFLTERGEGWFGSTWTR